MQKSKRMPKIYEYFGFIFYFYTNEHEPIHVHVRKAENETIYDLIFENGILKEINKRYSKGIKPLNTKDDAEAIAFIKKFSKGIANKWVNLFVYKKRVVSTKITKKV